MPVRPKDRARVSPYLATINAWQPDAHARLETCTADDSVPGGYRLSAEAEQACVAKLAKLAKHVTAGSQTKFVTPETEGALEFFGIAIPPAGRGPVVEDSLL